MMPSAEEILGYCDGIADMLPPVVQGLLDKAEAATKIPKRKIVAGGLVLFALYMIVGYFAAFICNFVGFALPAYWSMHAIETSDKEDDTRWLTYWVVFAAYSCVDFFADGIFKFFPFYWIAKICFLAWCFAPVKDNGSQKIYTKILRPYFIRRRDTIDKAMHKGQEVVNNLVKMD